ncbi:MAG: cache domain-containing protein [Proteobacteria bacterium]|nr:cache domain-containing protein [Pseudomonadota bacterium]
MFKRAHFAIAIFLFALMPVIGVSADAPSRNDVIAQVTKAVEFYRANGREKTLAELNRRDGVFARGMDYVDVHDLNGICLAHPISPDVVGLSRLDVVDMHGKRFIKEIVDAAKTHQDGWVTYMRENPNSGAVEHKIIYWAVRDGLIFKAGTYE